MINNIERCITRVDNNMIKDSVHSSNNAVVIWYVVSICIVYKPAILLACAISFSVFGIPTSLHEMYMAAVNTAANSSSLMLIYYLWYFHFSNNFILQLINIFWCSRSRTTIPVSTISQFPNNSYTIYNSFVLTGSQIDLVLSLLYYSSQPAIDRSCRICQSVHHKIELVRILTPKHSFFINFSCYRLPVNICDLFLYIFHYCHFIFLTNSYLLHARAAVLFLRMDSDFPKIVHNFIREGYSFFFE